MKRITDIYLKYKEIINYLIAGVLTTIVSILSYALFKNIFHIHYIISNIISWIIAVTFAYVINSKYVFGSNKKKKDRIKEFISFVSCRVLSLIIETLAMYLMVDIIDINSDISKIIAQFIVLVLNYVFSKFLTFKK